jgi:hypothetical protein
MAILVGTDGSYAEIALTPGPDVDNQVHALISSWFFEVIGLGDGLYMVYCEDGKRRLFPCNEQATSLARHVLSRGEYIAGPALVVPRYELEM